VLFDVADTRPNPVLGTKLRPGAYMDASAKAKRYFTIVEAPSAK
jgi:hypothetical protein